MKILRNCFCSKSFVDESNELVRRALNFDDNISSSGRQKTVRSRGLHSPGDVLKIATHGSKKNVFEYHMVKDQMHMERHEDDLKQKITNICELILNIRLYKSGFSPTALEQGLIASICGMTHEGQDIFSSTGLACSRTTVKKVLDYFISAYVARVKVHIQHARADKNRRLMVILDN